MFPMGKPLHAADLAKATLSLNSKIRQSGLTASEAHLSRDSATLDHFPPAQAPDQTPPIHKEAPAISPGDTVYIKLQGGKHHVREPFMVTDKGDVMVTDKGGGTIKVQKIINSFPTHPDNQNCPTCNNQRSHHQSSRPHHSDSLPTGDPPPPPPHHPHLPTG